MKMREICNEIFTAIKRNAFDEIVNTSFGVSKKGNIITVYQDQCCRSFINYYFIKNKLVKVKGSSC